MAHSKITRMEQHQKISVIIAVLNGEKFIAEALQSVMDQDYNPLEIIVVDDGSTDKTAAIVKTQFPSVHYHYHANKGIPATKNVGVEAATGDFITFLDADDIWVKNKLALQLRIFHDHPEVEVVYGFSLQTPMLPPGELFLINLENEKGAFATQLGSMLIRKSVFGKVGNFDEEMKIAEDLDWVNRIREAGIKIMAHKEIVQFYRMHDQNVTRDKKQTQSYILKAYKKSLTRRRKEGQKSPKRLSDIQNIDEIKKYWKEK